MRIQLSSVIVKDQEKALHFYTAVLGFVKKEDRPVGEFRWLTVVSPQDQDGVQLLLEPNAHPAAVVYQRALYDDGIPLAAFRVENAADETKRLKALGVVFAMEPTDTGDAIVAILDDTCGNMIQIYEVTRDQVPD